MRWQVNTDVLEFKESIANQNWKQALSLYKGEFLQYINPRKEAGFNAWLEQERADLARVWRNAVHKHVETLEAKENYQEATVLLKQLLKSEPLAEDVLQRYLRSSYLIGESKHALAVFDGFKDLLKKELDLEPLEETIKLINKLKAVNSKPHLTFTSLPRNLKQKKLAIPLAVLRPPKLIGREETIRLIEKANTTAIFLAGEAGIGKTRLMSELAPTALRINCQEGLTNIPYYPVIQLIRSLIKEGVITPDLKHYTDDLARLVPEAAPNLTPGPTDPETGRSRLFEALSLYFEHVINLKQLKGIPLLLDDLQWADSSTLDFLTYLANRQSQRLLAAYRVHEQTDALKEVIKGLNSSNVLTQISLEPLTVETVQDFLASLMNQQKGPPVFSNWLLVTLVWFA